MTVERVDKWPEESAADEYCRRAEVFLAVRGSSRVTGVDIARDATGQRRAIGLMAPRLMALGLMTGRIIFECGSNVG